MIIDKIDINGNYDKETLEYLEGNIDLKIKSEELNEEDIRKILVLIKNEVDIDYIFKNISQKLYKLIINKLFDYLIDNIDNRINSDLINLLFKYTKSFKKTINEKQKEKRLKTLSFFSRDFNKQTREENTEFIEKLIKKETISLDILDLGKNKKKLDNYYGSNINNLYLIIEKRLKNRTLILNDEEKLNLYFFFESVGTRYSSNVIKNINLDNEKIYSLYKKNKNYIKLFSDEEKHILYQEIINNNEKKDIKDIKKEKNIFLKKTYLEIYIYNEFKTNNNFDLTNFLEEMNFKTKDFTGYLNNQFDKYNGRYVQLRLPEPLIEEFLKWKETKKSLFSTNERKITTMTYNKASIIFYKDKEDILNLSKEDILKILINLDNNYNNIKTIFHDIMKDINKEELLEYIEIVNNSRFYYENEKRVVKKMFLSGIIKNKNYKVKDFIFELINTGLQKDINIELIVDLFKYNEKTKNEIISNLKENIYNIKIDTNKKDINEYKRMIVELEKLKINISIIKMLKDKIDEEMKKNGFKTIFEKDNKVVYDFLNESYSWCKIFVDKKKLNYTKINNKEIIKDIRNGVLKIEDKETKKEEGYVYIPLITINKIINALYMENISDLNILDILKIYDKNQNKIIEYIESDIFIQEMLKKENQENIKKVITFVLNLNSKEYRKTLDFFKNKIVSKLLIGNDIEELFKKLEKDKDKNKEKIKVFLEMIYTNKLKVKITEEIKNDLVFEFKNLNVTQEYDYPIYKLNIVKDLLSEEELIEIIIKTKNENILEKAILLFEKDLIYKIIDIEENIEKLNAIYLINQKDIKNKIKERLVKLNSKIKRVNFFNQSSENSKTFFEDFKSVNDNIIFEKNDIKGQVFLIDDLFKSEEKEEIKYNKLYNNIQTKNKMKKLRKKVKKELERIIEKDKNTIYIPIIQEYDINILNEPEIIDNINKELKTKLKIIQETNPGKKIQIINIPYKNYFFNLLNKKIRNKEVKKYKKDKANISFQKRISCRDDYSIPSFKLKREDFEGKLELYEYDENQDLIVKDDKLLDIIKNEEDIEEIIYNYNLLYKNNKSFKLKDLLIFIENLEKREEYNIDEILKKLENTIFKMIITNINEVESFFKNNKEDEIVKKMKKIVFEKKDTIEIPKDIEIIYNKYKKIFPKNNFLKKFQNREKDKNRNIEFIYKNLESISIEDTKTILSSIYKLDLLKMDNILLNKFIEIINKKNINKDEIIFQLYIELKDENNKEKLEIIKKYENNKSFENHLFLLKNIDKNKSLKVNDTNDLSIDIKKYYDYLDVIFNEKNDIYLLLKKDKKLEDIFDKLISNKTIDKYSDKKEDEYKKLEKEKDVLISTLKELKRKDVDINLIKKMEKEIKEKKEKYDNQLKNWYKDINIKVYIFLICFKNNIINNTEQLIIEMFDEEKFNKLINMYNKPINSYNNEEKEFLFDNIFVGNNHQLIKYFFLKEDVREDFLLENRTKKISDNIKSIKILKKSNFEISIKTKVDLINDIINDIEKLNYNKSKKIKKEILKEMNENDNEEVGFQGVLYKIMEVCSYNKGIVINLLKELKELNFTIDELHHISSIFENLEINDFINYIKRIRQYQDKLSEDKQKLTNREILFGYETVKYKYPDNYNKIKVSILHETIQSNNLILKDNNMKEAIEYSLLSATRIKSNIEIVSSLSSQSEKLYNKYTDKLKETGNKINYSNIYYGKRLVETKEGLMLMETIPPIDFRFFGQGISCYSCLTPEGLARNMFDKVVEKPEEWSTKIITKINLEGKKLEEFKKLINQYTENILNKDDFNYILENKNILNYIYLDKSIIIGTGISRYLDNQELIDNFETAKKTYTKVNETTIRYNLINNDIEEMIIQSSKDQINYNLYKNSNTKILFTTMGMGYTKINMKKFKKIDIKDYKYIQEINDCYTDARKNQQQIVNVIDNKEINEINKVIEKKKIDKTKLYKELSNKKIKKVCEKNNDKSN